jgi:thiol-disulfide isomerase/thioredoxin
MKKLCTAFRARRVHAALAVLLVFVAGLTNVHGQTLAIKNISEKGIKDLVAQKKGKVLLINFWATWCPPCLEEFPALVKISSAYKDKGLEVVGISMNDVAEMNDLQAFLRKQKPSFAIYIAGTVEDKFYTAIDKRWTSEIPLTMIYDKEGKLRYFHNDARTYAQFEKDVQSLLGASR